jgi:hypothetical protein
VISLGKIPQYPFKNSVGGLQSQCDCFQEEKYLFLLPGTKSQFLGFPAHSLITIPTELSRFPTTCLLFPYIYIYIYIYIYKKEREREGGRRGGGGDEEEVEEEEEEGKKEHEEQEHEQEKK